MVTSLIAVLGLAATLLAAALVYERQQTRATQTFLHEADVALEVLSSSISIDVGRVHALRGLFHAAGLVTPEQFGVFVASTEGQLQNARAMEWLPVVSGDGREAYEAEARQRWPGFRITSRRADGRLQVAADALRFVPIAYVEPAAGNEAAVGYDLYSDPVRRQMLQEALLTNALAVSGRIHLVQHGGVADYGVLAALPVYAAGQTPTGAETLEERWGMVRGFVVGVYELRTLVESARAVSGADYESVQLAVFDVTEPERPTLLFAEAGAARVYADWLVGTHRETGLQVGGRSWSLVARPPQVLATQPQMVVQTLVIGLLLTLVAASLTRQQLTVALDIEREVSRRTLALNEANQSLAAEAESRRRAQMELQTAEARVRAILNATGSGIVVINQQLRVETCNAAYAAMHGYTLEQVIGEDPIALMLADACAAPVREAVSAYLRGGPTEQLAATLEAVGKHRDGHEFPILASVAPMELPDGRRVVGVHTDVTELKQIESERDLFFNMTHDLFAVCTLDGLILRASTSFQQVLGYHASELVGQTYHKVVHTGDHATVARFLSALEGGSGFDTLEDRLVSRTGEVRWFRWSVVADREHHRIYCSGLDITDRMHRELAIKELNANLAAANARLESMNVELQDFAHIISHDLKAPLRGITTLVTWLQADHAQQLDAEGLHLLELLQKRTDRLGELLEGVLRYSRATRVGAQAEVDVAATVREVLAVLPVPPGFQVHIAPDLPPVRADEARLYQVFLNLIDNAIKHHDRETGEIRIWSERADGELRYCVGDDGPGIEPRQHARVFQIFQVGHQPADGAVSGIGLAIVKRVMESLGGRIRVLSDGVRGTTMVLVMPGVAPAPTRPDAGAAGGDADASV